MGAKLYFAGHLVQLAGIVVGVRGALAHANWDFSAKREGYLARAVHPGNFRAPARWSVATFMNGLKAATRSLPSVLTMRIFACAYGGYRTIFTPYAELHHYEFTSRSREEASEEKLRRWKREQALFMQHWLEFFLTGDPWLGPNLSSECVYGALKITVLVLACC